MNGLVLRALVGIRQLRAHIDFAVRDYFHGLEVRRLMELKRERNLLSRLEAEDLARAEADLERRMENIRTTYRRREIEVRALIELAEHDLGSSKQPVIRHDFRNATDKAA